MNRPKETVGLRHVALFIKNFDACEHFYVTLLGMKIDWRPDSDNLYLTSGTDNLALHRAPEDFTPAKHQRLDHIGFFLTQKENVDEWYLFLLEQGVTIKATPKDHRDGTRSFYCADPDGNIVQFIHYPRSLELSNS
jgi:catechol 2,3-dioxygenase-like lactoylglutathione lyase family enzyme